MDVRRRGGDRGGSCHRRGAEVGSGLAGDLLRELARRARDACAAGAGAAVPATRRAAVLLKAIPAEQARLAGGLLNASRRTGGAVAVAVYGALVSGSFLTGMRTSSW